MIVLNLSCNEGHQFEGWFASREAFDEQLKRGQVNCAHCHTRDVAALPSGPRILRQQIQAPERETPVLSVASEPLVRMFRALAEAARRAEDVGERFVTEARRIHYDEAPQRAIRGVATPAETEELLDEGIMVLPALVPPDRETH